MDIHRRILIVVGLAVIAGCSSSGQSQAATTTSAVPTVEIVSVAVTPSPSVAPPSPAPTDPPATLLPAATPSPIPPTPTPTAVTVQTRPVDPDPSGLLPGEVAALVPLGYELLGQATGDLNLDGRPDLAIVVRIPGDADFVPTPDDEFPARPMLLFVAAPDGTMQLASRSDDVALCGRCGGMFGDPFNDITIGPGTISVNHSGGSAWRWAYSPTFAYDIGEADWVLTGIDAWRFHASDPDNTFEDLSETDVDPVTFADYISKW